MRLHQIAGCGRRRKVTATANATVVMQCKFCVMKRQRMCGRAYGVVVNYHLCIMLISLNICHNHSCCKGSGAKIGANYTTITHLLGGQRKAPLLQGSSCNMGVRLCFRCSVACALQTPLPHFVFLMRDDGRPRHLLQAVSFQRFTSIQRNLNAAFICSLTFSCKSYAPPASTSLKLEV